jgi:hypothetical protein
VNSSGTWSCNLGKPCGFFIGDCGTCPALTASSSATVAVGSSPSSSNSPGSTPSTGSSSGGTSGGSSGTSGGITSGGSTSNDASPVHHSGLILRALAAFLPAYILAV